METQATALQHRSTEGEGQPLRESVRQAMNNYFNHIGDMTPSNVHQMVLDEVLAPMLEVVMKNTRGNQCKASRWLGISRGTLRKLLKKYQID